MKVNNITLVNFNGIKYQNNNKKKNNNINNQPEHARIPADKLNKALKAMIIVPIVAGGLSSCEGTEHEFESIINPPHYADSLYVHRFPEITINGTTFSEQTVYFKNKINPDTPLNKAINGLFDTLGVPKKTEGAIPANLFWSNGNNVYHMMIDGAESDDSKYTYHLTDVNKKAGTATTTLLKFTEDNDRLNLCVSDFDKVRNYNFVNRGDSVILFRNYGDESVKAASFKKEMIPQPGKKDKYTIEQTTYGNDTARVNLDNFVVWSVNNQK